MTFKRICPICGEDFETTSPGRIYCNPVCSKEGDRRKQAIYRKEHREEHRGLFINDIINDSTEPFVNKSQVGLCSVLARESGLSYGYFMARKEGRL